MYDFSAEQLLAQETFEVDIREFPDNVRRGRFRSGWDDYTVRQRSYAPETLTQLTWTNLGYRMGMRFGDKSPDEIDTLFEMFASHYESIENQPPTKSDQEDMR